MTKPNDPNVLISRLVDDLRPVSPAPKPALGTAIWVAGGLSTGAALLTLVRWRSDVGTIAVSPAHLAFSAFLFLGICALGFVVFRSGIPGRDVVPGTKRIEAGLVIGFVVLFSAYVVAEPAGSVSVGLDPRGVHCGLTTAFLSVVPAASLLFLLNRRYATVRPRFTARALGLGAGLFGVLLVSYYCPSDEGMHQLAWHLAPGLLFGWIFSKVAAKFLRF